MGVTVSGLRLDLVVGESVAKWFHVHKGCLHYSELKIVYWPLNG